MTTRDIRNAYAQLDKKYSERTGVNGVTEDQAAALQGTSGEPSDSNRYVTEAVGDTYVVGPASATDNNLAQFNGITGKIIEDSGLSNTDTASAISLKHTRSHAITGTSDHTSTATPGQILKADASGLPIDATNTDAEVSGTVSASHGVNDANSSSEPSGAVSSHSALTTGVHGVGAGTVAEVADIATDANLSAAAQAVVTAGACDVDANLSAAAQAAITASHTQGTDTGTSNATFSVGDLKFFGKSIQLADHATQVLTTAAANYPSHGFVQVCTTSAITESAEFEMGSDGTVNLIRGTSNIVANVDTTAKFCIGTSAAQNPLIIKNHLEVTVQAIIQFWHA